MRIRLIATCAAIAGVSFGAGFASGMAAQAQEGVPDQRMGIAVATPTEAKLVPCRSRGPLGCFRMFLEVNSNDGRNHEIAQNIENGDSVLSQTFAYLSDGGVCKAWADSTLPRLQKYWSANRNWVLMPSNPITVAPQQPFSFPVLFECDQQIESGDMAQVQISIGVGTGIRRGTNDEDAREVHFKWPRLPITAKTIR